MVNSVDRVEAGDGPDGPTTKNSFFRRDYSSFWPLLSRLLPYWLSVAALCWSIAIIHAWNSDKAYDAIQVKIVDKVFVRIKDPVAVDWGFTLVNFTTPILIAACLSVLILTNAKLPAHKLAWANKAIARVIRFRPAAGAEEGYHIAKKNQFLKGEANFNFIALFVIGLPFVFQCTYFKPLMDGNREEYELNGWDAWRIQRETIFSVSMMTGWIGIFALMWFLIPVARHSVLLVAMGWSPVHALRLHIWAGHLSFLFVAIHAITMFVIWFMDPIPVYQQFIPPAHCWAWNAHNAEEEEHDHRFLEDSVSGNSTTEVNGTDVSEEEANDEIHYGCNWQWFNLSGLVAMIIFTVLWVSSLHWFRRRNYRLFYLLHVIFGTLMILSSLMHYAFMIMYWIPSITYYLASTMPTLIQALAARFRGGVKIVKVVKLRDAAGCCEVHVETTKEAAVALNKQPSQFVKLCVPKISVVWHPFTVFSHPQDPATLRFLFRPVGPFTKQLSEQLTAPTRPVTMLDGFYTGANRCEEALAHDNVTIVSGGVAITPFLSMIPALLTEIGRKPTGEDVYTKTITLHWSCREKGLMMHVLENYLKVFQKQARSLGRVKFDVHIYHTGKDVNKEEDADEETNRDMTEEKLKREPALEGSSEDNSSGTSDVKEEDAEPGELTEQQGFAMELGRMMPARFSHIKWNVPLFIAFNTPIWLGFVLFHETYYQGEAMNYKEFVATAFYTVVCVLICAVFGGIVEMTVLHLRSCWPSERLDDFVVVESTSAAVEEVTADTKNLADGEVDASGNTKSFCGDSNGSSDDIKGDNLSSSLQILSGRPTGRQVLEAARQSEAPGIFMCGPEAMVTMVKNETKQENAWWIGRTRFCLYDEPFEF